MSAQVFKIYDPASDIVEAYMDGGSLLAARAAIDKAIAGGPPETQRYFSKMAVDFLSGRGTKHMENFWMIREGLRDRIGKIIGPERIKALQVRLEFMQREGIAPQ